MKLPLLKISRKLTANAKGYSCWRLDIHKPISSYNSQKERNLFALQFTVLAFIRTSSKVARFDLAKAEVFMKFESLTATCTYVVQVRVKGADSAAKAAASSTLQSVSIEMSWSCHGSPVPRCTVPGEL